MELFEWLNEIAELQRITAYVVFYTLLGSLIVTIGLYYESNDCKTRVSARIKKAKQKQRR